MTTTYDSIHSPLTLWMNRATGDADTIVLRYVNAREVHLAFTESGSKTVHSSVMTHAMLRRHLTALFQHLAVDAEPFEFLQVDYPLMPSIMYKIENLGAVGDMIMTAIFNHIDLWTREAY